MGFSLEQRSSEGSLAFALARPYLPYMLRICRAQGKALPHLSSISNIFPSSHPCRAPVFGLLGTNSARKIHFEGHTPGYVCRRPLLYQVSLQDGAASWCLSLPPRRKATGRQHGFQEMLGDSGHAEKVLGAWLVPSLCALPSCPMAGEGLPHGDRLLWLVSPWREVLM